MKRKRAIFLSIMVLICLFLFGTSSVAQEPPAQRVPKRLSSTGDSMTEAIDAEVYGANHWASWANGYHGFWQWLFGLSNVNSHNQRITRKFGRWGRKNFMEAEEGADSFDLLGQAEQAVAHDADYVLWLMGHNDICQDYEYEIPTADQFEANARTALTRLSLDLPLGATIYVHGMVDVPRLYDVAQDKKALGILDCEFLWFLTVFELFPCGTVLGPFRTEADRIEMSERIVEFNDRLQDLVMEFSLNDGNHYYYYSDEIFDYSRNGFAERDVSDLDCFHPSIEGQRALSRITWDSYDGPRFQDW